MSHEPLYVPILKAKAGEFAALKSLEASVSNRIYPLFELVPSTDSDDDKGITLPARLDRTARRMVESWGGYRRLMVDGLLASGGEYSEHPLDRLFGELLKANAVPVAVTGVSRDLAYREAVKQSIQANPEVGVCFRMRTAEMANADGGRSAVEALLSEYSVAPSQTDLVLDFGEVNENSLPMAVAVARMVMVKMVGADDWRTVVLASGAFPEKLSDRMSRDSTKSFARLDWQLWSSSQDAAERRPLYSDYAVNHPGFTIIDPKKANSSGNIRYTGEDAWTVVRGHTTKRTSSSEGGFEQMRELCRKLIEQPDYAGPDFSKADRLIQECSLGFGSPGNATTWREVGTEHHITTVVRQLASWFGS